jgi:hypothetical protein
MKYSTNKGGGKMKNETRALQLAQEVSQLERDLSAKRAEFQSLLKDEKVCVKRPYHFKAKRVMSAAVRRMIGESVRATWLRKKQMKG